MGGNVEMWEKISENYKSTKGSVAVINFTLISYTTMLEWEKLFYRFQWFK